MLTRLSFNHRKSDKKTDLTHNFHPSQNSEKQNNLQNLNRPKRTLKLTELDPAVIPKPTFEKNYFTNADNSKLILSLNLNFNLAPSDFKGKLSSRLAQKQAKKQLLPKKEKNQSITEQYYELYGKDIIRVHELMPIHKSDFLKSHQIDASLRARMLDWMVEVTKSYKFINKTYFSSVELLDRFFMASSQSLPVSQLHIIGVTAMYIASKMDEIYPLKIKTIFEKIVHKKISKESLLEMEHKMFDTLNHKVNSWTFFDLALLKLSHQFGHDNIELKTKVEEVVSLLAKFVIYDYDLYLRYDMETFAKVLAKIASKICDLPYKNETYSMSCHEDIARLYKRFKISFKGVNNIFKFSEEKILAEIEKYFSEDIKK